MRIGFIGSVNSSYLTLQKLIEHKFEIIGVWGYEPVSVENVSSYSDLGVLARTNELDYYAFDKINNAQTKQQIKDAALDILFIVGLSQLVDEDIINAPKYGCVGFHPTKLPEGRGRAPLAWLVHDIKEGAATFFEIDKNVDGGKIYVQKPFIVFPNDDVYSVKDKLLTTMKNALDEWLPKLKQGNFQGMVQDEAMATYYARRAPLDGYINWERDAYEIDRLIKTSTHPYVGAFSFYGDYKVIIWKSNYYDAGFPKGVIGRVVAFSQNEFPVVQTLNGFVELCSYEIRNFEGVTTEDRLNIGSRLGYYEQYEIYKLRNELKQLKEIIKNILDGK